MGRVVHRATPGNGPRRRRLGAAGHDDRIRPRARRVDRVAAELEHPDRVAVRRLRVRLVAGHRCQRDVLHAVDHVGDRGGLAREARLEAPQHIAGRRIHGGQHPIHPAEEEQTRGGDDRVVLTRRVEPQWLLPDDLHRRRVERRDAARLVSADLPQAVAALGDRVRGRAVVVQDVAHVEQRAVRRRRHVGRAVTARHREPWQEATLFDAAQARRTRPERNIGVKIVRRTHDQLELTRVGGIGPSLVAVPVRHRAVRQAGNVRTKVLVRDALLDESTRGGTGLCRPRIAASVVEDRTFFDGDHRLAVGTIERELMACLAAHVDDLLGHAADRDVGDLRR